MYTNSIHKGTPYISAQTKMHKYLAEENNEYFAHKTGGVKYSFIGLSPRDQYWKKIPMYCHKILETFHGGKVFLQDDFH